MRQFGTLNLPNDNIGSVDEPTDEQLAKAKETVDRYQDYADALIAELLDSCRKQDATRGGIVTLTIHKADDLNLLMMVLGGLSAYAIGAEKSAVAAHGPLIPPEQVDANGPMSEPWATSAVDQMKAAASHGDYTTFGNLAVESHIKALIHDKEHYGEDSITLPHVVRAMMMIDQQTLSVLAAEALLRLFRIYEDE